MSQKMDLADNLLENLSNGAGNSNTIRLGKRDISLGTLTFSGTESKKEVPVYVRSVVHKKLNDLTPDEAKNNGADTVEECINGMIALYTSLGREITRNSDITIIEYAPYQERQFAGNDFVQAQERWRGGQAQARWAQAGEVFVKRDGVEVECKGGEVAILKPSSVRDDNPLGDIDWALPQAVASKSYTINALPSVKTDATIVTVERNPELVKTITMTKPTWFTSPFPEDNGARRYLNPGDMIEFNPKATPTISPVTKDMEQTRYVSPEAAQATLNSLSR